MSKAKAEDPSEHTAMEALLGSTLIQDEGKVIKSTKEVLASKDLVMLYFSASWCPPCQTFSPKLKEFQRHVKDSVEIIYIGSDRTEQDFAKYFATLTPWWSLPEPARKGKIQKELSRQCKITGIPTLLLLHCGTGGFVTDEARETVEHWSEAPATAKAGFAKQIIREWRQKVPIPLRDARLQGWDEFKGIEGFFMTIMRHPALFLGVVLTAKWLWNKWTEMSEQEVGAEAE